MATITRLSVDLVANSAQFRKDLNKAAKSADKSFGSMMKKAKGATAAFAGLGLAAGKVFMDSAKTYGNFTEALSDVEAKTGASVKQLDQLATSMRNAAKATKFTATQTAEAGTFLAQAGLNVKEINDALRPTLDLAAATKTSVQNTADFMTNIMKGMGMSSEELGRASDVLATTTASANTNLTDLATAMSYAAPSMRAMNMSIEETSALIGIMANAGIKGSMAGTALRRTFVALSTTGGVMASQIADATGTMTLQTKTLRKLGVASLDANGKVRNLTEMLNDLKAAGADEGDMIKIFGARSGSALMQFMNEGLMDAERLRAKLEEAKGAAERMAAVQMNNLNGDLLLMNSQFKEMQMIAAESGINDLFRSMAQMATKFMKDIEPFLKTIAPAFDEIAIALGVIGGAVILGGIVALTGAMWGLAAAMLANPVTWIVAAFAGLAIVVYKNIDEITFYWHRFTKNMGIFANNISGLVSSAWANIGTNLQIAFVKMQLGLATFKQKFLSIFNGLLSELNPSVNKLIEMYNSIPFLDDAKPITLNIDTSAADAKVTKLKDELVNLSASLNTFTQQSLDNSVFTPSAEEGLTGPGIEDVISPESKALTEQEQLRADLEAKAQIEMGHLKKLFNMKADWGQKTTDLATGGWEDIIDAGAKGSKKLAMIQKASAIRSILTSTATGIAKALELPFPANIAAGIKAAAAGAIQLQKVKGQFHDGIDSVPGTGTYLLEQGERVVDNRLNKDLSSYLAAQNSSNSVTNNPTLNFNVSGGDAENVEQMLLNHRGKFEGMIRDIYNESAQNSPF